MSFIWCILGIVIGFALSLVFKFDCLRYCQNLWDFSICDVISLLVEIAIGGGFAFYISKKESKETKKIDFLIDQIETLKRYIEENVDSIHEKLLDLSNTDNKKSILLFFKTINAKVHNIKNIEIKQKINFESVEESVTKHKKKIYGDEFDQNRSYDQSSIDEFKKDMESINQILDTLLIKILNGNNRKEK